MAFCPRCRGDIHPLSLKCPCGWRSAALVPKQPEFTGPTQYGSGVIAKIRASLKSPRERQPGEDDE